MPAKILDGRALAAELREGLSTRALGLRERGIQPRLLVVVVGEDPSNAAYIRGMQKLGTAIGIEVVVDNLAASIDDAAVRTTLERHGSDATVHGIILQQPLPAGLSIRRIADAMPVDKDVDGTNPANAGRLAFATGARFVPATPAAVMLLLERSEKWPLRGCDATVIGRSSVIGLPVSLLLVANDATVTVVHSRTTDSQAHARRADVLVVAIGKPEFVDAAWIKPGATVIDVGTTVVDGKVRGDVDFDSAVQIAGELTPVPGGVGPVTNIALMRNVIDAAESSVWFSEI
jgi:methylenetetrahydrofolate dehydrogenase (NADP+)/methenyltetrahydrofolate cyclohydrolase